MLEKFLPFSKEEKINENEISMNVEKILNLNITPSSENDFNVVATLEGEISVEGKIILPLIPEIPINHKSELTKIVCDIKVLKETEKGRPTIVNVVVTDFDKKSGNEKIDKVIMISMGVLITTHINKKLEKK